MTTPVVVQGNARALPLADCSVDAAICDPPYELAFMGRSWDASGVAFDTEPWQEALRVLKPGGHLAAFGASRTYHRLACAIEDAGFEMRDSITAWLYGSGMPKSRGHLKPAIEPIVVARKPFRGSARACTARHGTGALNASACRVAHDGAVDLTRQQNQHADTAGFKGLGGGGMRADHSQPTYDPGGRWPSNIVFAHHPDCEDSGCPPLTGQTAPSTTAPTKGSSASSTTPDGAVTASRAARATRGCAPDCQVAALDEQSGSLPSQKTRTDPTKGTAATDSHLGTMNGARSREYPGEQGGASRFFPTFRYQAKAPAWQRPRLADGAGFETVKPLDLMRWLVRLLTPPGGLVLDPFPGTGTTGQAAQLEGFASVLVELDPRHIEFIRERLAQPVRVDRRTDEAVPVAPDREDEPSLFDLLGEPA